MCSYISAFYRMCPDLEVRVACLSSHGITEEWLELKPDSEWQEMHYLPSGYIECRKKPAPLVSHHGYQRGRPRNIEAEIAVRRRWPTFAKFESWAVRQTKQYYTNGFDRDGYDRNGFDEDGYDRDGYDRNGFDEDGHDRDGFRRPLIDM